MTSDVVDDEDPEIIRTQRAVIRDERDANTMLRRRIRELEEWMSYGLSVSIVGLTEFEQKRLDKINKEHPLDCTCVDCKLLLSRNERPYPRNVRDAQKLRNP